MYLILNSGPLSTNIIVWCRCKIPLNLSFSISMILKTFQVGAMGQSRGLNFFLIHEMWILEKFYNFLQEQPPVDRPLKRVVDLNLTYYLKTMPTAQIKV